VCIFLPRIVQKNHKTIDWQDRKKTTIIKKSGVFDQRFFWKFFTFFRVRVVVTKNYDFGKGFSFSSLISIYAQVLLS